MAPRNSRYRRQGLLCSILAAVSSVRALDIAYCSSENTGGSNSISSIYMSNGKCYDQCISSYAYAVLLGQNCWCSNYTPADTTTTSLCNSPCPGYPSDTCGNTTQGLYGYIRLSVAPSGTAGGSSTSTSTSQTSAVAASTSSIFSTSQSSQAYSDTSTTSQGSSGTSQTQQSSPSTSTTTPITSIQTVTQSGNIIIQTVTSTPTNAGSAQEASENKKSSGTPTGVIAAAVVASIFGFLLLAGAAFFLWRRKKRENEDEKFGGLNDSPSSGNINRNASTHSKAGLLDRAYPPTITTRMSSQGGLDMSSDAVSPVTTPSERRTSRPLMYDQRLNPVMVLDNGSRTSVNTIEDSRDYGRMLKVTNPDRPNRPSFS